MRDFVWPRCPSGWNGEERQFFRALIEVLQRMGQPIKESDLDRKLISLIKSKSEQDSSDQPETPEEALYELFNEGYIEGVEWTGNILARPQYTGAGKYSLDNVGEGYMQVGINATTNATPITHNAHLITKEEIAVPESAKKMKVECLRYCADSDDTTPINIQFGLLPTNAPGSFDTSNGGQLSRVYTVSAERIEYEMNLNVDGKYKAIINCKGTTGKIGESDTIPARYIRVYKVWFE